MSIDPIDRYRSILERKKFDEYEAGKKELARARRELLEVETQLSMAFNGNPYRRIGRINTVDAGMVFAAFGAIENLATFDKQMNEGLGSFEPEDFGRPTDPRP